jgi:membrane protease YdiL (CAAX protease family)
MKCKFSRLYFLVLMNDFYEFNDLRASLIITGTLVFFYSYYYFAHSLSLKNAVYRNSSGIKKELQLFFIRKLSGLVLLGVLPVLIYILFLDGSFNRFGFTLNHLLNNLHIIAILIVIIAVLLYLRHKNNPGQNTLQINTGQWTGNMFLFNILGWSFYLLAYELLFRGILLFECYESFGFWTATAINITIYSAIHMVNGKDQALGALLFGSIACYFTLTRGTVLIPFFMHLALSVLSDYFSIKMNPDMVFKKIILSNK